MVHQPDNIFAGTQVDLLVKRRPLVETKLPERPDHDLPRWCASTAGAANRFLIKARREMANHE